MHASSYALSRSLFVHPGMAITAITATAITARLSRLIPSDYDIHHTVDVESDEASYGQQPQRQNQTASSGIRLVASGEVLVSAGVVME